MNPDIRHKKTEDGTEFTEWDCKCGAIITRFRGQGDQQCWCGQWYNAGGQRLRSGWRNNPSNYDDEIGDMEGYEMSLGDY